MDAARRTHHRGVVLLQRLEGVVFQHVAPGLIHLADRSRRAEAGGFHLQRLKDLLSDQLLPRQPRLLFQDRAQDAALSTRTSCKA